ncbi:hypothetical protein ACTU6V_07815 [Microbacterium sp. A204]|uniref:hypothetical protein n=1 Tax=Microbacterium sp. A204 TaxID=3457321 RepID=UPI003FD5B55F
MHPSLLFFPGALLSQPELNSARLDGLLFEVGDGYMPPDLPEDAAARVASLKPILVPGYAASGPTAAWVHGTGNAPPAQHHLQRVIARRQRVHAPPGVVLHDVLLDTDDFEVVGGAPVTTVLRTLTDLALAASSDEAAAHWMRCLADSRHDLVARAIAHVESRPRLPGKHAALSALRSV